jgi:hypothetical protein
MVHAAKSTEANDVIFFGDSSCRIALATLQFQRETGLKAFNIGSLGQIYTRGFNLILREYLRHHPRPRLVVLCIPPQYVGFSHRYFRGASAEVGYWFHWCYGEGMPGDRERYYSPVELARRGIRESYAWLRGGQETLADEQVEPGQPSFNEVRRNFEAERGFERFKQSLGSQARRPSASDPFDVHDDFRADFDEVARCSWPPRKSPRRSTRPTTACSARRSSPPARGSTISGRP